MEAVRSAGRSHGGREHPGRSGRRWVSAARRRALRKWRCRLPAAPDWLPVAARLRAGTIRRPPSVGRVELSWRRAAGVALRCTGTLLLPWARPHGALTRPSASSAGATLTGARSGILDLQKASQNVVSSCSEPSCPFPWMVLCVITTCHRSRFPFLSPSPYPEFKE